MKFPTSEGIQAKVRPLLVHVHNICQRSIRTMENELSWNGKELDNRATMYTLHFDDSLIGRT